MKIVDSFIARILDVLPEEGLDELEGLIDGDDVSAAKIEELLKKYNVDVQNVLEKVKGENS